MWAARAIWVADTMSHLRDEWLTAMYDTGRGNATARRYVRLWNAVFRLGLLPRRWVTLEVPGRRSGRLTRFPLGMADVDSQWYLVSMLGECNWVRNVRGCGGRAVLGCRRAWPVQLDEVPADQRAPVLKRYVQRVPGARPHIPIHPKEPVEAFAEVTARYPIFHVTSLTTRQ